MTQYITPQQDPLAPIVTAIADRIIDAVREALTPNSRTLVSVDELSAAWGVCSDTIRKLVREGMPHIRIGTSIRIEPTVALEWLRKNNG